MVSGLGEMLGVDDPAAVEGSETEKWLAFRKAFHELESRVKAFTSLPLTGAKPSRNTANALTTADAALIPTTKARAKDGSAGDTSP